MDSRVSANVVTVTPAAAVEIRRTCHFERQRNIAELNVRRLSGEMSGGRFIQGTPVFFCVLPDGSKFIVNGNHTLEAVAASGTTQTLVFVLLRVADMDEVAAVYATFDLHKARTWGDALRAHGLDEEIPWAGKVLSALGVIQMGFAVRRDGSAVAGSRGIRIAKLEDYKEQAILLHGAATGGPAPVTRLMTRKDVLAVALETATYQPTQAFEFWRGFALDDGLKANDPRKALMRYLQNHSASGNAGDAVLQAYAAAGAWNAYRRGDDIAHLKPGQMTSFRLAGTPWGKDAGGAPAPAAPKPRAPKGGGAAVDLFGVPVKSNGAGSASTPN